MERSLLVHCLAFLYLCIVVSLSLSCYREENVPRILRETARRSFKFAAFIGLLAAATYGLVRFFVDR
ncbi:MAG: hypothetical protein HY286_05410 [Planctomycetes bacterium]|nr:hypothetical protein [Planctomycetota bacterium]